MQLSCIDARSDIKANHKLKACVTYAEAKAAKETSESDTRKAGRYTRGPASASRTLGRAGYAIKCVARFGRVGRDQAPWLLCVAAYERRLGARIVEPRYCRRGFGCRKVFAGSSFVSCG